MRHLLAALALLAFVGPAVADEPPPPTASQPAATADPLAAPAPAPVEPAPAPPVEPAPAPPAEPPPPPPPPPPPTAAAPAPPPYVLPFYMRGVAPGSVVRLESTLALYQDPTTQKRGITDTTMLTATYKVAKWFAPLLRLGLVSDWSPDGKNGVGLSNLGVGGVFGWSFTPNLRLGAALVLSVPTGMGSGNTPDPQTADAVLKKAGPGRFTFDGALFTTNEMLILAGVDFAFVWKGLTLQVEATLIQFFRVRGELVAKDELRTLITMGFFAGYYIIPQLSVGAEVRYSIWASTPAAVAADATGASRDHVSLGGGLRGHFKLHPKLWFRPAIAYHHAVDDPAAQKSYSYIQVDLPFAF